MVVESSVTVNGHVARSSGKTTTWVNGVPQYDTYSGRDPARVHLQDGTVKIGQTLDRTRGEVKDGLEGGIGPRQSEAAAAALMLRGTAHAQRPARLRRTGRAGDRRRDAGFVVFMLLIIIVVGSVRGVPERSQHRVGVDEAPPRRG